MVPIALFGAALVVRAAIGLIFPGPAYPDSYYYVNVAQQLAAGNGFQVDYIWSFVDVGGRLPDDPRLPIPSNAHWMPLASLIQVPFIWLLGPTPLAAGLPFWLGGAAAAPLTWAIARDARMGQMPSAAAGAMVAVPAGMTAYFAQPDNFGLYITLGALALWLCARGLRGERRSFVLGGAVVGLATLSRNDGVLLGVPFAAAFVLDLWRNRGAPRIGLAAGMSCAGLFLLVMAPWLIRQLEVFGTFSPSAAGGRILWPSDYNQMHSIRPPSPSPATLLGQGFGPLVSSRLNALATALAQFAILPLAVALAPFFVVGIWKRRSDPALAPFLVYALLLFAFTSLLFAVHVRHGAFLHSAAALLPHSYVLVQVGIASVVGSVARRRVTWKANEAIRFFSVGAVAVVLLAAVVQTPATLAGWERVQTVQRAMVGQLAVIGPGDRLISIDAGAYRYLGGHPGVITPIDPLPVIEAVARAYGVRWLALEAAQISPALEPVLRGEVRPAWLSEPVLIVGGGDGKLPLGTLHAVCLDDADSRCPP